MTFVESVRRCFSKYADFAGCASRPEYWWWMLFVLIACVALEVIHGKLSLAFQIATCLPTAAVTARRLHDTDRSGWLQLVGIIPVLGWLVLIFWCVQDGKRPNRFESD